jgi:hypothetical protein
LPVYCAHDKRAIEALLDFAGGLPIRHAGDWSRDDLYG